MGIDANAIVFGKRSMEELAAAVRASGVAEKVEVLHGTTAGVRGQLLVVAKANPRTRIVWVYDEISDHLDVYSGERTLMNVGMHDDGAKLLEAAMKPFGGYLQPDDRVKDWRPVASAETEFSPQDRLHIEVARLVGPARAEILMPIIGDDERRESLIAAIREVHPEPAPAPGM